MAAETPKAQLLGPEPDAANHPRKSSLLLTHFAYKVCLVTIFLVLVPLFPSLAPDFLNQILHARSWEVLQLIFVGIAVSYGLFSKKNDQQPPHKEKEKDHNSSNTSNAHSYVSKLLQVSSVFDDESETLIEDNKMLNSSQYFRGQPPVVVAPKPEKNVSVSEITQKPLLLPVRSLKHTNDSGLADGKTSENVVVLPSPIPWRSRSGRMEMEVNRKLSPSTSVSPVRKTAPPPPPPPPPQIRRKSTLMKSNSAVSDSPEKEVLLRRTESEITRRPNSEPMNEVLMETTDDDSEIDDDDFMEGRSSGGTEDNDGGPDVDKKADEFIAKFREQIRQQRIESIRKTAAQRSTGKKLATK